MQNSEGYENPELILRISHNGQKSRNKLNPKVVENSKVKNQNINLSAQIKCELHKEYKDGSNIHEPVDVIC